MATIDLTWFSPEHFQAAKPRWKALSADHKFRKQVGGFDFGIDHYGGETNEGFEIDFWINLQNSTLSILSYFSRADDAGADAAYAKLTLILEAVPTNPRTVYKVFVAANTRAKWLMPVYGRVFRRSSGVYFAVSNASSGLSGALTGRIAQYFSASSFETTSQ